MLQAEIPKGPGLRAVAGRRKSAMLQAARRLAQSDIFVAVRRPWLMLGRMALARLPDTGGRERMFGPFPHERDYGDGRFSWQAGLAWRQGRGWFNVRSAFAIGGYRAT